MFKNRCERPVTVIQSCDSFLGRGRNWQKVGPSVHFLCSLKSIQTLEQFRLNNSAKINIWLFLVPTHLNTKRLVTFPSEQHFYCDAGAWGAPVIYHRTTHNTGAPWHSHESPLPFNFETDYTLANSHFAHPTFMVAPAAGLVLPLVSDKTHLSHTSTVNWVLVLWENSNARCCHIYRDTDLHRCVCSY